MQQSEQRVTCSAFNDPLSSSLQSGRAEEPETRPKGPLRCSLSDAGLEQRFDVREDQPQSLEPSLPQTAAQPHEI